MLQWLRGELSRPKHLDANNSDKECANYKFRAKPEVAIVIMVGIIILLCCLSQCSHRLESNGNITFGVIEVQSALNDTVDLQKLANEIVAQDSFRVFIATRIEVDKTGAFCPLIQNAAANRYACRVELVDEFGCTIWISGIVEPGYKIECASLNESLIRGMHNCKAYFHVLESADENAAEVNAIGVDISVIQR